jgi:TolA-binding protein
MNDIEKIIELLDKDSITSDEKKILDGITEQNPEAKKISQIYLKLKMSLKQNDHIDEELMGEYVLYKNNNSSERVIILLSKMIEDHIRKCNQCENLFKELNAEYTEVDEFIIKSVSDQIIQNKQSKNKTFSLFNNFGAVKYAFASLTVFIALYLGLFMISSFTTPDYKKAFIEDEDFYTTRGRTSELFQRGLDAIDKKDFESAIQYLNDDINKNPNDESIFYTHFVLGITYVNKAETNFLGLFKSFDRAEVQKGIVNFEESIELNKSGRFDNLNLDAQYFIGKSYLMIDDKASAKEHLQLVVDGKGSYYKKAEDLLKYL